MKKGLLSLLALALTVVGCQNYDDQFDELTELITEVQGQVAGLSALEDRIAAIETTVNGLATLDELQTATAGLATSDSIEALQSEIDSILEDVEALSNTAATQDDIDAIEARLDSVDADLDELLAANAVINQNITIRNVATLEYVESLISTDEGDPNVIINGNITVEVDEDDFNADQVARVNAVIAKFATSLGSLAVTNTYSPSTKLTFTNLSFVDSDTTISGDTNLADGDTSNDILATVSGDLTISNVTGGLNLSGLTSAGDIRVPTSVTELLFGAVEADSFSTIGSATGELQLFSATRVDGGDAIINYVYSPLATDVDVTMSAAATETIVYAPVATTIDISGNSAAGRIVTLTATDSTIIHIDALSAIGTITSNDVAELHIGALANAAHINSDAVVANLADLASVSNGIEMHEITNFNAPKLDVAGVVSITAAEAVTVKDVSSGYEFGAPEATSLTISALADTNNFAVTGSGNDFGKLTDLTVGGVADSAPSISNQTNTVSSTSAVLENITTTGMIDQLMIFVGTDLESVSTDGNIRHFELRGGGSSLTSVSLAHEHIEGSDAASLVVAGNSDLAGLTTTELDEIGTITVEDNSKLTAFDFSSFTTLPQLGSYTITLDDNNLAGNYVEASLLVTTTAARVERIRSASLVTLKTAMLAAAADANVSYEFDGEILTSVTTSTRSNVNNNIVATSTNTETLEYILNPANGIINSSTVVTGTLVDEDFTYVETL